MTTATSGPGILGPRLIRHAARVALLIAAAALCLLAAGPLGWRVGWWSYSLGLGTLLPWSFFWGCGGALLGLIAIAVSLFTGARGGIWLAVAAIVIGTATAAVPWHLNQLRGKYPSINDITTDMTDPPQFVAAIPLRAAEAGNTAAYGGAATADRQRKAYPDIVPLILPIPPAEAFAKARAEAERMGWTIDASDPAGGRIEAYDRSRWFGFADDIAIRVTPADGKSRIDIRSASRHGRGDFGVNATRIRKYLAALRGSS